MPAPVLHPTVAGLAGQARAMTSRSRATTVGRRAGRRAALVGVVLLGLVGVGAIGPDRAAAAPIAAGTAPAPAPAPAPGVSNPAPLSAWDGSIDLYRGGIFTTQQTWRWCTAAGVQMMRNVVLHQADHSYAGQKRYWRYMRSHNRYDIPARDGVDPAGWAAGLRRFVDGRYRVVASSTFNRALRTAVTALRRTSLPVGLLVAHGNHAWVLTGFAATADPAVTNDFRVTSVRVVGPLWGLQSRTYGYDMRPDRKLTRSQLHDFLKRWHYAPIRMAWEGEFVTILPTGS
jgi:hypothetical protein